MGIEGIAAVKELAIEAVVKTAESGIESVKETTETAIDAVKDAELNEVTDTLSETVEIKLNDALWEKEGDKPKAINNKLEGNRREIEELSELQEKYPESEGYKILRERDLLDKNGNAVKKPETDKNGKEIKSGRRLDFVVLKDGKPIKCIEVTSETADKTLQMEKEKYIRENGGVYIKDYDDNLIRIPDDVTTEIKRRK